MAKVDFTGTIDPHYRAIYRSWDAREGPLTADGVELCLGDNFVFVRRDLM